MDPYSPKSSPRGSSANSNPMDAGGGNPLKLSIALGPGGQNTTIIQKGPFYLMKPDALPRSEITGATNLMASKGLEHSYVKLTSKLFLIINLGKPLIGGVSWTLTGSSVQIIFTIIVSY